MRCGQNTSYFFKFDVVGDRILKSGETATVNTSNFYSHQYMTNIMDPYSQSASVYNMYAANGNIDASLNFIIPIYNNMPELNTRPTKYTEQDGELYYAQATAEVKDSPIKTSKTVYTMVKGEVAVMVSRKHIMSDDAYWDIVMLENGWNVYVESSKLESCKIEIVDTNEQLDKCTIDEANLVIKTTPVSTADTIADLLGEAMYNIVDTSGKESQTIATGYKVNILKSDNTIEKTYTLVKVGDVNGDAKVSASDYVLIKNLIMESKQLTEAGNKAADINEDGKVTAGDYVRIKNYIMENKPINIK